MYLPQADASAGILLDVPTEFKIVNPARRPYPISDGPHAKHETVSRVPGRSGNGPSRPGRFRHPAANDGRHVDYAAGQSKPRLAERVASYGKGSATSDSRRVPRVRATLRAKALTCSPNRVQPPSCGIIPAASLSYAAS